MSCGYGINSFFSNYNDYQKEFQSLKNYYQNLKNQNEAKYKYIVIALGNFFENQNNLNQESLKNQETFSDNVYKQLKATISAIIALCDFLIKNFKNNPNLKNDDLSLLEPYQTIWGLVSQNQKNLTDSIAIADNLILINKNQNSNQEIINLNNAFNNYLSYYKKIILKMI
ncbi:hypothetical protein [Mycoplasmopsis synoviae]|uniref:hypothetical protein n=1 Tax=Mycoplasmopsis synoviae TaxID=2109 RepID=UPI0034DAF6D3